MLPDALRAHDSTPKIALRLKRATFATRTWSPSTAAAYSNDASLSEQASTICQRTLYSRPRRASPAYFVQTVRTKMRLFNLADPGGSWRMWRRLSDDLQRVVCFASCLTLPMLIILILVHFSHSSFTLPNPMHPNATLVDEIHKSRPTTPRAEAIRSNWTNIRTKKPLPPTTLL